MLDITAVATPPNPCPGEPEVSRHGLHYSIPSPDDGASRVSYRYVLIAGRSKAPVMFRTGLPAPVYSGDDASSESFG